MTWFLHFTLYHECSWFDQKVSNSSGYKHGIFLLFQSLLLLYYVKFPPPTGEKTPLTTAQSDSVTSSHTQLLKRFHFGYQAYYFPFKNFNLIFDRFKPLFRSPIPKGLPRLAVCTGKDRGGRGHSLLFLRHPLSPPCSGPSCKDVQGRKGKRNTSIWDYLWQVAAPSCWLAPLF